MCVCVCACVYIYIYINQQEDVENAIHVQCADFNIRDPVKCHTFKVNKREIRNERPLKFALSK